MRTSHVLLGLAAAAATVGVIWLLRRQAQAAPAAVAPSPAAAQGAQAAYSGQIAQNIASAATGGGGSAFKNVVIGGATVACTAKTGQAALCGAGAAIAANVAAPVVSKAVDWTKAGGNAIASGLGKLKFW